MAHYLIGTKGDPNTDALEVDMRSWREKFQAMAMAVAFAEEGEWDTAQSLTKDSFRAAHDEARKDQ